MDIIAEKNPDEEADIPEQPTLTREMTTTQDDSLNPPEPPAPKKRGRPPGNFILIDRPHRAACKLSLLID